MKSFPWTAIGYRVGTGITRSLLRCTSKRGDARTEEHFLQLATETIAFDSRRREELSVIIDIF